MPAMSPSSFAVLALAALTAACASTSTIRDASASADLRDSSGKSVGSVLATPSAEGGVTLVVNVTGLPPGPHGIHVHAVGACEPTGATAFASAGGHFNPGSKQHGRLNPNGWHAGDMPNLIVDASGGGALRATAESLTLDVGPTALLDADGSAVVIHANQDDERTDNGPSGPGNSGARIACGVLRRN